MFKSIVLFLTALTTLSFTTTDKTTAEINSCLNCRLYVPNAFSPNNDGLNDEFKASPGSDCVINDYVMKVFDRNGSQVFTTNSQDLGWDGLIKGEPAPSAVYLYVIQYTFTTDEGEEQEIKTGDIALFR